MTDGPTNRAKNGSAVYVMPPYWQCPKCLIVVHDPSWTLPEHRRCQGCSAKAHRVYTWPGTPGDVYHAALHNLGDNDDWTSVCLRTIVLCSLIDAHNSRLLWSVLVAMGCPRRVAISIEKGVRQPSQDKLFQALVGEKRRKLERSGDWIDFWRALQTLRTFRNSFVHCEPETHDKEIKQVASGLEEVIRVVAKGIEPAFQELTNNVLARIRLES